MFKRRSTLSDIEDAGEYAMKQVRTAAKSVGKSARQVSGQIEDWASDGYEAVRGAAKSDAAFWGAVVAGMGGLFGLWRFAAKDPRGKRMVRDGKRMVRSVSRTVNTSGKRVARAVAAANRDMNRFMRSVPLAMPGMAKPSRKRSRKITSRSRRRKTAA